MRTRVVRLVMDDGQFHDAVRFGILEDVVHRPGTGYALVLRNFCDSPERGPRRRRRGAGERVTVPLSLVSELPESLSFLMEPPADWPMPEPFVSCPSGCGHQAGRFCASCGSLLRRRRFLGEGFAVMQALLSRLVEKHPEVGHRCRCGGMIRRGDAFCSKCGLPGW